MRCTFADDIVGPIDHSVPITRREEVDEKLKEFRRAVEDRVLKISRNKTVYGN